MRRLWDIVLKYGPGIAVVIGALWTAAVYIDERSERAMRERQQQARDNVVAVRDSQKPFLERQLEAYFQAATVTAKLATLPLETKLADWREADQRFWELFWGELAVVESIDVAKAMVDFRNALTPLETCVAQKSAAGQPLTDCAALQKKLPSLSLAIARRARESIEKGWGYQLPDLTAKNP